MFDVTRPFNPPTDCPIPPSLKAAYSWRKDSQGYSLKSRLTGLSYSPQAARVLLGAG